ncbi:MAG: GNAT family N-acetyltransferase [Betaproteobacteria bacterium]|nr:GNAT family N-acetyltransferase [Betaproteobacteria bacterium]
MTASTEHALTAAHLAGALALTRSANWNQNEADWRTMLELGRGWGITAADGTLAASTLVIPYGTFAWVSMVLVLPEHRRKGYASQLLRTAIAYLEERKLTPLLDATPAGHEVYVQEGFRDTWGFRRFSLKGGTTVARGAGGGMIRPLAAKDWPQVLALDAPAFGASREGLLRTLAQRLPEAALVAERGGEITGYLLGRDGHEARQLGPLVARDATIAQALLAEALSHVPAPLYVDVADHVPQVRTWLEARGFAFQRPFTRMVHGADRAPGDESGVALVAGPELG